MYDAYTAYAVCWVPPEAGPLAAFGRAWTGWCADQGARMPRHLPPSLRSMLEGLVESPARTGLHGVIAPPFAIAAAGNAWNLETVLGQVADATAPIRVDRLRPAYVDGRVALVADRPPAALERLTGRVQAAFSVLAAPSSPAGPGRFAEERAAFLSALAGMPGGPPANLSPDRFHMPLTDRIAPFRAERILRELGRELEAAGIDGVDISDIALMGDPGGGRPARVLHRAPLAGRGVGSGGGLGGLETFGPSLFAGPPTRRERSTLP